MNKFFLSAIATLTLPSLLLAQEVNILDEGDFETTQQGMPAGFHWTGFAGDASVTPNTFEISSDSDGQFVKITVPPDTDKQIAWVELKEAIPVPAEWTALGVSAKLRVSDYVQGPENWHGVKVFLMFYNENGDAIGSDVPAISLKEDAAGWVAMDKEVIIPPGSAKFKIKAGIMGSSGVVEIDNLSVIPVK